MYWWQYILFPFALLFHLVTWLRNSFYNTKVNRAVSFDANVVLVGNLSIGGTGKTPMVDYLIKYFYNRNMNAGTLSRGYGRKTYGFRLAGDIESADTIGDEPYMYYEKYNRRIPVAVGGDRILAITEFLSRKPSLDVILMDDGFQHRSIRPDVSIVLTTYANPFFDDHILPAGRLRESKRGANRADIIIVTKCPDYMSESEMVNYRNRISEYSKAKVFFMSTMYDEMESIFDNGLTLTNNIVAISGMAYPEPFESYLRKKYSVKLVHNYRDHHRYSLRDVQDIMRELKTGMSLVCTEKDKVKLKDFEELRQFPCFYQPISMVFLKEAELFQSSLESYLNYNDIDGND